MFYVTIEISAYVSTYINNLDSILEYYCLKLIAPAHPGLPQEDTMSFKHPPKTIE
jgi:hypothetical protein